jgi:HD-like signal output (HDOD) protein
MRRILFVDDEAHVLEGLRDSLRPHRREWQMTFAPGGEAALEALDQERYDVIVSDMRMPGMGGAELLQKVRDCHPEIVRIILSGHSEFTDTVHAAPFAHQFLAKPCPPDELHRVIERSCALYDLLADERLKSFVAGVTSLPAVPDVFREFTELLADPSVTPDELGRVVEQDVALFAKVLQLVNSSFFRLARRITSGREAVSYLGFGVLKALVLSIDLFQTFSSTEPGARTTVLELERHASDVGRLALRLAESETRDDAFAAGLLHDVGKLVLLSAAPADFAAASATSRERSVPLHAIETELLGVSHAEIGAYLLGLWGLPHSLVGAVARHHHPQTLAAGDAAGVAARANALVNERNGVPVDAEAWAVLEAAAGAALDEWRRALDT